VLALGLALDARADPSASRDAAPADGEPPVELPEVEVRVPRAEVEKDPTASATVVSAARFEGEAKDVAELLSTAPGVSVTRTARSASSRPSRCGASRPTA
jgi:hypothetical protein